MKYALKVTRDTKTGKVSFTDIVPCPDDTQNKRFYGAHKLNGMKVLVSEEIRVFDTMEQAQTNIEEEKFAYEVEKMSYKKRCEMIREDTDILKKYMLPHHIRELGIKWKVIENARKHYRPCTRTTAKFHLFVQHVVQHMEELKKEVPMILFTVHQKKRGLWP
jgi:hypothetical protein